MWKVAFQDAIDVLLQCKRPLIAPPMAVNNVGEGLQTGFTKPFLAVWNVKFNIPNHGLTSHGTSSRLDAFYMQQKDNMLTEHRTGTCLKLNDWQAWAIWRNGCNDFITNKLITNNLITKCWAEVWGCLSLLFCLDTALMYAYADQATAPNGKRQSKISTVFLNS